MKGWRERVADIFTKRGAIAAKMKSASGSPSFFALPTIVDKLQDDAKKIGGDNSYQINIGV